MKPSVFARQCFEDPPTFQIFLQTCEDRFDSEKVRRKKIAANLKNEIVLYEQICLLTYTEGIPDLQGLSISGYTLYT